MTGQNLLVRLGRAGLIGIGVLLFCASFYVSALSPLQAEATRLAAAQSELERQASQAPAADTAVNVETDVPSVPALHEAPALFERLHILAEQSKVSLDRPAYTVGRREGANVHDYALTLAVKGAYPDVRTFLAALAEVGPGVVFEGVSLQRGRAVDPLVDAQIRLTASFEARP